MGKGKVYLVGAGPGDPGLLTIRGKEILSRAEVVVYDHLVNPELLGYAPKEAERIYVGKEAGKHTLSQQEINDLLVAKGRDKKVVRLKGGDPYMFGRGGEEAEILAKAGIEFEVVPGITAAVAVPAYAGIPLTHRDYSSSVAFIAGHERGDHGGSRISWDKLADSVGTLVFFMGVRNLPVICRKLLENGRAPDTPVAVIRWGTLPRQQTVVGTLADIDRKVIEANIKPPAIVVAGSVVRLRSSLNWFEARPLFGRTIAITRATHQARELKEQLEALGAYCVEFPTIKIVPPPSWEKLDNTLKSLACYDWMIFTSVNGVYFFFSRLFANGYDVRDLKGIRIAAIGPKTAEALESYGLRLDLVPEKYCAEGILEEFKHVELQGASFLIPRAMNARDILPKTLEERGALVEVVPVYQTVPPEEPNHKFREMLKSREIDCLTFTSSSTVRNFFTLLNPDDIRKDLQGIAIACIGPITAKTIKEFGFRASIIPEHYTISALVESICKYYTAPR